MAERERGGLGMYRVESRKGKNTVTYHGKHESFRDACREADSVEANYPDRTVSVKEVRK